MLVRTNIFSLPLSNTFILTLTNAAKLAKITRGYAYAYQLLGYLLVKENKKCADDEILIQFDQYLAEYVYDKLWSELTFVEKDILKSIQNNDEIKIKDLKINTNKSSSYISLYRERLIKKGILESPSYGYVRFTLPRFAEYIKSQQYL